MGISPSSYNILNQRFSDIQDVQTYLNSMGDKKPKNIDKLMGSNQKSEDEENKEDYSLKQNIF